MNSPVLQLKNIRRNFEQGGETLHVLNGVNLSIKRGEIVALLGPSGSGKTTLLQISGLLESPTSGEVIVDGQVVSSQADDYRTRVRRTKLGFVYQFHHLLSDFTAFENLMLPQYVAGVPKEKAKARADELLASVGLSKRAHHYPSQLSGGEQQRVAIVRGLVNHPALLLADEPTGNLDPHTAEEVFKMLLATIRRENIGALVVTHNIELGKRMDRMLELKEGLV